MAVLVTGGTGVLGSFVVRELVAEGVETFVYDLKKDLGLLADIEEKFTFVHGDILDLPWLIETVTTHKVRRIIHFAAVMGVALEKRPQVIFTIDGQGSMNVFEVAKLCGVERVVLGSSKGVLRRVEGTRYGHPIYEPVPPEFTGPERRAITIMKLACEQMGQLYMQQGHFEFCAVRFAEFYCAERLAKESRSQAKVFTDIVVNAYLGRPSRLAKGGDQIFDPIYAQDCARGTVQACFTNRLLHSVYQLGPGEGMTLSQAAAKVQELVPEAVIQIGPGLDFSFPGDDANFCVLDITAAQEDLDFMPAFGLAEGIQACGERAKWLTSRGVI